MSKIDQKKLHKVVLGIEDTKKLIKYKWKQLLDKGPNMTGPVLFIEGVSGIGKTQLVSQVVSEMNEENKDLKASLIVTNFSGKDAQDVANGLPYLDLEAKVSRFAQAEDFPVAGNGILFMDEFNRLADQDVKTVLLSMLQDRAVNGKKISDGFIFVTAGNPFGNDEYDTIEFDRALHERIRIVELKPTHQEVLDFLRSKYGKDNFLVNYCEQNSNIISFDDSDKGVSPRTFEKTIQDLYAFSTVEDFLKDASFAETLLKINLGALSNPIVDYLNQTKTLNVNDVLSNNVEAIKKINKNNNALNQKIAKELIPIIYDIEAKGKTLSETQLEGLAFFLDNVSFEAKDSFLNEMYMYEHEYNPSQISILYNPAEGLAPVIFDRVIRGPVKTVMTDFLKVYEQIHDSEKAST